MAPTLQSACSNFLGSLSDIGASLFQALLNILTAFLAFGQTLLSSSLRLAQSFVQLGLELCQGALGFVLANFVVIALLGGGYYWYTRYYRPGSQKKMNMSKK